MLLARASDLTRIEATAFMEIFRLGVDEIKAVTIRYKRLSKSERVRSPTSSMKA